MLSSHYSLLHACPSPVSTSLLSVRSTSVSLLKQSTLIRRHDCSFFHDQNINNRGWFCVHSFPLHARPLYTEGSLNRLYSTSFQHKKYKTRNFQSIICSAESPNEKNSHRPPWNPWSWFLKLAKEGKFQIPLRILFNVLVFCWLMRVWPMGGRLNGDRNLEALRVPFSTFIHYAKTNNVDSVVIDGPHIRFSVKSRVTADDFLHAADLAIDSGDIVVEPEPEVACMTIRPSDYNFPYKLLEDNDVVYRAVESKSSFPSIWMFVMWGVLLLLLINRLPSSLANKGPGRKHKPGESSSAPEVRFADVAGVDEAKEELAEVVEFLRSPERFSKLGARPPTGVLLVGPPGTGKTLLARAVAGEAGVPFFSVSASEFVELFVGVGAVRVRELFARARREAPAIVFIDEIDAVAKGRDSRLRGAAGNDEREQTLNQLLTELDGFESGGRAATVICIAATNRPDVLDPALLRPGRFDRRVSVERPDKMGREQILGVHIGARKLPLAGDVSVGQVASMTTGFTGADLANLVNEAAILAGRGNKVEVSASEFEAAVLRMVAGVEKKRSMLRGMEKEVVARHEAGHALVSTAVSRLLPLAPEVEKLSIVPRSGGALGFTYTPPKAEDRALLFEGEIRGQLAMLMGGRAAEMATCESVSTGAADDIRRATELAMRSVTEYGLSSNVGPLNVDVLASGPDRDSFLLKGGGEMSRVVEGEVKALVEAALNAARDVVEANQSLHDRISSTLVREERINKASLTELLQDIIVPASLREFIMQRGAAAV